MPTVVDVLNETRLTLSQAAKLLPGPDGGQASRQAVRRWVADGVKLEAKPARALPLGRLYALF